MARAIQKEVVRNMWESCFTGDFKPNLRSQCRRCAYDGFFDVSFLNISVTEEAFVLSFFAIELVLTISFLFSDKEKIAFK